MSDEIKRDTPAKAGYRGDNQRKDATKPAYRGTAQRKDGAKFVSGGDGPRKGGAKPAYGGKAPRRDGDQPAYRGDGAKPFRHDDARSGAGVGNGGGKPPFRSGKVEGKTPYRGDRKPSFGDRGGFRGNDPRANGRNDDRRGDRQAPDGLAARRLALAVIREVTENGAYASLALDEKLVKSGLNPADRRLVSRLVYDTLEHLMTLDHALNQVMAKPDTDIKLRNVLRLGACQILLEDRIPESAATNTSVNLCKEIGMEGLAGVCNGILRNLIRQKDELQWPDEAQEPVRALSVRHSVPEWLVERLETDWGREEAVALMSHSEPETSITVRPNLIDMDDEAFEELLNKKVWEHEKGAVPHSWRIRGMADIGRDADFLSGRFSIQGESSMLACMAVDPKRGMQLLDACAAPGGKTCLMAEMMGGTGRVQAWEVHEHRTALIAAQVKRLQLENVRPMTRDAAKRREELDETMDAVLLDAPCSGLGVMADKPDVKYRVTEESVAELTALQARLLDAVAPYVKRGGTLVYSTCSVLKDENVRQVEAFLQRHPEYELDKLPESIPEAFRQHADVGLQLMPHRDHVGGFYICRMRRKRV